MQREFVIVGGGLSGVLTALALGRERCVVVERGARLGGNHLWSFHLGDVPDEARALVEPLVVARWPRYCVAFPDHVRVLDEPYASISSERLDAVAGERLDVIRADATRVGAHQVELADGRVLRGRVLDCRGPRADAPGAWQKFIGVELDGPHGIRMPTLMDARVEQRDGFRFLYVLPLSPTRVLVEDTCFSTDPALDSLDPLAWARAQGLRGDVVRREEGVLPLPLRPPELREDRLGYGGGFFHPTTGYSLPVALRVALCIARGAPLPLNALRRQQRFAALLNRLLFRATEPGDRWRVLSRFYKLRPDVIRRFYALESTAADRLAILCGRPPRGVSLPKAMEALA